MSRGTRGKNKRSRQEETVDITDEILRKIHATGEVDKDDVNQLYMVWKPVCGGCRVNNKNNPNCFCGFVPSSVKSRKTGLWQKMSGILKSLGPDPNNELRASPDTPAGLTNLGATCYANSILQCLYMNRSFRRAILSVEPHVLIHQPVINQLAMLFAKLQASKMAVVESSPFIKTLELDDDVQQDSHEFLTLFLPLLESGLSISSVPKARRIVQDLFRGSSSTVTTCLKCRNYSDASWNMEDFYGLELNVKGLNSLEESLDEHFSAEKLQGEDQYHCHLCMRRVDATRIIKLHTLPNVLILQLRRCVFDQKTMTKKKISSVFSFPGELDMCKWVDEPSQMDLTYDLSAVLIHKGNTVNSGHYIAHIKDENTEQWWKFDDEYVSSLDIHPFGGESSSKNVPRKSFDLSSKGPKNATSNGRHVNKDILQPAESCSDGSKEIFSSTEAYMLIYNRRGMKKVNEVKNDVGCSNQMETEDNNSDLSSLFEEIDVMNASYTDACKTYKEEEAEKIDEVKQRRQEVESVLSEAPVQSCEDPYYWISTDWLRQWADDITPPAIDNTAIQCAHGKVSYSKNRTMKRLSTIAWTMLLSKYKGGPTLANDDYCRDCLIDAARSLIVADDYKNRRELMKELAKDVLKGNCSDGAYYVSRSWLQQWVKRKNLDAPCEADAEPTASITCPHGQLMPEQAGGPRHLLVPENLWNFLYEDGVCLRPDGLSGCSTFHANFEQCTQCSNEHLEAAGLETSLREFKLKQRQNHENIAAGKRVPLSTHCKYYLLPSSWISTWRKYIGASGKNSPPCMQPETLDHIVGSLICDEHSRLVERPPDLFYQCGSLFQKTSLTEGLTVITEDDWYCFCKEWGYEKERGISALIEFQNSRRCNMVGSSEEAPLPVEQVGPSNGAYVRVDSGTPVIKTFPEICEECIERRENFELEQKRKYSNEYICVCLVRGNDASRLTLESSKTTSATDHQMHKRRRRNGKSINLKVSGSTPVYWLKILIWKFLGVFTKNQILQKGSNTIDDEQATLADLNIFPGDMLWVMDSGIHENQDICDGYGDEDGVNKAASEGGFGGSLLSSSNSSQLSIKLP